MSTEVNNVYEVFKDYYGEDRVDLQGNSILVYFPKVTISNEKNESIDITDLYVKTDLHDNGTIKQQFTMTRGSYTTSQIKENYLHSHVLSIPSSNTFSNCCTGTGPITRTITLLTIECDLDRWALYCYELDKYVQVESEDGIPYHRLSKVTKSKYQETPLFLNYSKSFFIINTSEQNDIIKSFIPYLIKSRALKFSKNNVYYYLAHSFKDTLSIITTQFVNYIKSIEGNLRNIQFYIDSDFLFKGIYKNGLFLTKNKMISDIQNLNGTVACTFKGNEVIINVINDLIDNDDSKDLIINPNIAAFLIYKILVTLNYGNIKLQNSNSNSIEKERVIIL